MQMQLISTTFFCVLASCVVGKFEPCLAPDYMCDNGRCLPPSAVGDDYYDCSDENTAVATPDEDENYFAKLVKQRDNCGENNMWCTTTNRCTDNSTVCATEQCDDEFPRTACGFVRRTQDCPDRSLRCYSSNSDRLPLCVPFDTACSAKAEESCGSGGWDDPRMCETMEFTVKDSFGFETPILIEQKTGELSLRCGPETDSTILMEKGRKKEGHWRTSGSPRGFGVKEGVFGCMLKDKSWLFRPTVRVRGFICSPEEAWSCAVNEVCTKSTSSEPRCAATFHPSFCELTANTYEHSGAYHQNGVADYRSVCTSGESWKSACSVYNSDDIKDHDDLLFKIHGQAQCDPKERDLIKRNKRAVKMYDVAKIDADFSKSLDFNYTRNLHLKFSASYRAIDGSKKDKSSGSSVLLNDFHVPVHARIKIHSTLHNFAVYEDFIIVDPSRPSVTTVFHFDNHTDPCYPTEKLICRATSPLSAIDGVRIATRIDRDSTIQLDGNTDKAESSVSAPGARPGVIPRQQTLETTTSSEELFMGGQRFEAEGNADPLKHHWMSCVLTILVVFAV